MTLGNMRSGIVAKRRDSRLGRTRDWIKIKKWPRRHQGGDADRAEQAAARLVGPPPPELYSVKGGAH
jgi:hypothetical protein